MAQHPYTETYPARALYGPRASFPDPQVVGDAALAVASDESNTLYQVTSGNWVSVSASGGGGGPGSDTTAVHRAADTSSPETGSAAITGDFKAVGAVLSHANAVLEETADPANSMNGQTIDFTIAGAYSINKINAPNITISPGMGAVGPHLSPSTEYGYVVQASTALFNGWVTSMVAQVTLDDPALPQILDWTGTGVDWGRSTFAVFRVTGSSTDSADTRLLVSSLTTTTWTDDGSLAPGSDAPSTPGDTTGQLYIANGVFSHNRPVAELGATALGTIIPDTTIILYDSAGTPYYIPAKAV